MFEEAKSSLRIKKLSHMSYDACCNNLHNVNKPFKPVLANISKQSIQSCTPFVNTQFAPGLYSD